MTVEDIVQRAKEHAPGGPLLDEPKNKKTDIKDGFQIKTVGGKSCCNFYPTTQTVVVNRQYPSVGYAMLQSWTMPMHEEKQKKQKRR